jgi:hypothetical protein
MSALLKDDTRIEKSMMDRYPPEVFKAHDDVTPEAVKIMRDRADLKLANKKWKKIDGVGQRKSF